MRKTKDKAIILNKIICVIMCAVLFCGLFAGCRVKVDNDSFDGIIGTLSDEHEAITINRVNDFISEEFIDALHKVYPEINLEIVSYAGLSESGYAKETIDNDDMTDIYVTTVSLERDLWEQRLVDLSNYSFVNEYKTSQLNSLDIDGGIYLLPSGYTVTGINYNKTIMEENGWEVPTSLEELEELAPKIEAAGYKVMANSIDIDEYCFNYFFNLGSTVWFQTQDGVQWKEDFVTGTANAADEENLVNVAEYFKRWIDDGFITSENTSASEFMENGDTVFMISFGLPSLEYTTEDGKTYEFGIMPWLSEDGSNNMLMRNVTRYFGINKHLEEEGNSQKLEDALHVMEFISSEEGQEALIGSSNVYLEPLNGTQLKEEDPYYEVNDLINSGHTVQMVYSGWEDIITPMTQKIRKYINGEIGTDELIGSFDEVYEDVVVNGGGDIYGTAKETLTAEETYRLAGIAEGKVADADCAMVSVNKYHGDDKYNAYAVGWKLYAGKVNTEKINVIAQRGETISVLELTGAEIKKLKDSGFDLNEDGYPYEYLLFTKGDAELDDEKTYRLAVSTNELTADLAESAEIIEVSPSQAIAAYVTALGEFGAADIVWN